MSVPLLALAAWMAARSVQVVLEPAIEHVVLPTVAIVRSRVLLTV